MVLILACKLILNVFFTCRAYFVPYNTLRGDTAPPHRWKINGDQLSSHIFQASARMKTLERVAKHSEDFSTALAKSSTIRSGLDSINVYN